MSSETSQNAEDSIPFSKADLQTFTTHLMESHLKIDHVKHQEFAADFVDRWHIMQSHRLILVTSGSVHYETRHAEHVLHDTMLFAPAWLDRSWRVIGHRPATLLWVVFRSSEFSLPSLDYTINIAPRDFAFYRNRLLYLRDLWTNSDAPELLENSELKSLLAHFFVEVMEKASTHHDSPQESLHPAVRDAVEWLGKHLRKPNAMDLLHERHALNRDYFRKLFHEQTGSSPLRFLTTLRMRAAYHEVLETNATFSEIAYQLGYQDPRYFYRNYRKFWGETPGKSRENRQHPNKQPKP